MIRASNSCRRNAHMHAVAAFEMTCQQVNAHWKMRGNWVVMYLLNYSFFPKSCMHAVEAF
jgi:hypothetical protein